MSPRVLFADPDVELLTAFEDYFQGQGFRVAVAGSGPACVRAIKSFCPQVLVLEPEFPWPWEQRILRFLRSVPGTRVVVLSRRDGAEFEPPVCRVYTKPIRLGGLADTIRQLVTSGSYPAVPAAPQLQGAPAGALAGAR